MQALGLAKVIFLPCRQSPHKSQAAGASEQQRLQMLQLATAGWDWAEVSDWEFHQPLPSYSWRTAEVFQEKYPKADLHWLMGWDQWEVLPSWNRYAHLASLVGFIVHARDGEQGETLRHPEARVAFVPGNHPASSSKIRTSWAAGDAENGEWLPHSVASFIRKNALYQE